MKLKRNQKVLFVFIIFFMFLFFSTTSYAGSQEWNSLDYDITVNRDGSIDVIETWDVDISSTNTMFKTFEDSASDYYYFGNVKVSEVVNGQEKFLEQIYEQQYHVEDGCFYALPISSHEYEIAWHVGVDGYDSRVYKMYYTVYDAVKKYDDCTELYWQLLSSNNGMTGTNVTGIIRLPKDVSNIDALRVWGHGNLSAEIYKESTSVVKFKQPRVEPYEQLEIRIVTDEDIYGTLTNTYPEKKLQSILNEEQGWADEANAEREKAKNAWIGYVIKAILAGIVNLGIIVFAIVKCGNNKRIREDLIRQYGDETSFITEMEYFRDIPDEENATPARAVYMRDFRKNSSNIEAELSDIFSATILNLSLKKILNFEMVTEKEVRIMKSSNADMLAENLPEDEKIVYDLIDRCMINKDYITTKDFNKFATREYDLFYRQMHKIDDKVMRRLTELNIISREKRDILKKWSTSYAYYLILGFVSFIMFPPLLGLSIGLFMYGISTRKNATCVSILSTRGQEEVQMWKGLKKYMEDYSMLDERMVPDIVLWEKYLVYATAFGIADKVLKQLKVVHPEMFEASYNGNGYWHIVGSPYHDNSRVFTDFSRDLKTVYSRAASSYAAAHSSSSSGSGGGGGFSGGGGGGGGGGSCGGR